MYLVKIVFQISTIFNDALHKEDVYPISPKEFEASIIDYLFDEHAL
jgi:hypothetical protein